MEEDARSFSDVPSPTPLKPKTSHHQNCFISCFRPSSSGDEGSPDSTHGDRGGAQPPLIPSSSSSSSSSYAWLRPRAYEVPEYRSKCLGGGDRHRRHRSADFRYDPRSYARNFDDGGLEDASAEDPQYRCFSSRLPASPPKDDAGEKGLLLKRR